MRKKIICFLFYISIAFTRTIYLPVEIDFPKEYFIYPTTIDGQLSANEFIDYDFKPILNNLKRWRL